MRLAEKVMEIYGSPYFTLSVAKAVAALTWVHGTPVAALAALEQRGEGVLDDALYATKEAFGPGWMPVAVDNSSGALVFLPVRRAAVEESLSAARERKRRGK
jgi:hypothetical protein